MTVNLNAPRIAEGPLTAADFVRPHEAAVDAHLDRHVYRAGARVVELRPGRRPVVHIVDEPPTIQATPPELDDEQPPAPAEAANELGAVQTLRLGPLRTHPRSPQRWWLVGVGLFAFVLFGVGVLAALALVFGARS